MQGVAGDADFYIESNGLGGSVLVLIIGSVDRHSIVGVDRWLLGCETYVIDE